LTRNTTHPVLWFSEYHHSLHTLLFAIVIAVGGACFARQRWKSALLCFIGFHLHLLEDLVGSRGPAGDQWPIPYLAPFSSSVQLTWGGQWALNAWPNFLITFALLVATFYLAWWKGLSPMEMISMRADQTFVRALRARFPDKGARA
jgi:inner membrane protein